jgi:hypothetical protein
MTVSKQNVKYIDINVTLRGRGILNFDSMTQYGMYNKWRESNGFTKIQYHENLKFSKANYYDEVGKPIVRIPKLSGDWIRHQLFLDSTPRNNSNVTLSDVTLIESIAHPDSIIRGYMFADKSGTIKRKSGVDVSDAELSNGAIPTLDIQSTSGARNDNSMFYRENIGEAEWKFKLVINLNELKFISMSDIYDRRAVKKEFEDAYVKRLNEFFETTDIAPNYYYTSGGTNNIPEYGILLSDEQTRQLVNRILKNITHIHHGSSCTGHAWFYCMDMAFVSTIGETDFIKNVEYIDDLSINNSYLIGDKDLYIKAEVKLAEDIKQSKQNKQDKKDKKEKKATNDKLVSESEMSE